MKIAALALSLSLALTSQAQTKHPMTFSDLMAMKRVSDPQISPGGKWVMFSVTEVSLEKNSKLTNLWIVPITGGKEVQLTTGGVDQTGGRFAPDGKSILLLSNGGQSETQIWTAKWNETTGTIQKPYPLTALATGADGAIWSPDSKRILFTSSVYPECSDKPWTEEEACNKSHLEAEAQNPVKAQLWTSLLYRHWNAYTGQRRSHVLVVEAANGEIIRDLTPASVVGTAETPTFSLGGPLGYAWAPDSHEIAYVTNLDKVPAASTNNDVFTLRLDDPAAKPLKVSTSPGSDDGPQYSPDGKYLAFRSQARAGYESDRFRLMLFDRKSKLIKELLPMSDGWIDELSWSPESEGIFYTTGLAGQENVDFVNVQNATISFLQGEGEFSDVHALSGAGKLNADPLLIAMRMTAERPSEVIVLPKKTPKGTSEWGGEVPLTHLNDQILTQLDLAKMESYRFIAADGAKVQGFIIRPPNFDPSKKYPVKFLIHGGPQGAWGDAWSYRWNPQLMAATGYVVVMVNPRGSTGYGQAFIDEVNGDWGGKAYTDLMLGLDAAEKQFPFIDKNRECALGASYGGFMANWILTHTNRFKCIVTHDGMYNPAAAYGDTEEMWFNEWEFRRHMPDGSLDPEPASPWRYAALPADQDPFRKWSPMLHIQDAHTPTLVIHSQRDYRLDVSEGLQLFTALQRLNVPSEMLYFPDEGHWVLKPKNSQLWNQTVSDWCDKWTRN